MNKTR